MGGVDVAEAPPAEKRWTTLTQLFKEAFPKYLAMGMTYKEFWRMSPSLVRDYREAYDIRFHAEEWARWRQGAYIYEALLKVAPVMRAALGKGTVTPGEYVTEPWPLTEKEAREREEAKQMEAFRRMLADMQATSKRELERRAKEKGGEVSENA